MSKLSIRERIDEQRILISSVEINVLWKVECMSSLHRAARGTHYERCPTSLLTPYIIFSIVVLSKECLVCGPYRGGLTMKLIMVRKSRARGFITTGRWPSDLSNGSV